MTPTQKLAWELHFKRCRANHTDQCGYTYCPAGCKGEVHPSWGPCDRQLEEETVRDNPEQAEAALMAFATIETYNQKRDLTHRVLYEERITRSFGIPAEVLA